MGSTSLTYSGPKGIPGIGLNPSSYKAAVRSLGLNIPAVAASDADLDRMTRMALAESGIIQNRFGNPLTTGLLGVGDVIRNRVLSNQYPMKPGLPDTVGTILREPKQFSPSEESLAKYGPDYPGYESTRRSMASILAGESPPVAIDAEGKPALNYGNLRTINNPQTVADPSQRASLASQKAFNAMAPGLTVVSAQNPNYQHTFGTIGASDLNFGETGTVGKRNPVTQARDLEDFGNEARREFGPAPLMGTSRPRSPYVGTIGEPAPTMPARSRVVPTSPPRAAPPLGQPIEIDDLADPGSLTMPGRSMVVPSSPPRPAPALQDPVDIDEEPLGPPRNIVPQGVVTPQLKTEYQSAPPSKKAKIISGVARAVLSAVPGVNAAVALDAAVSAITGKPSMLTRGVSAMVDSSGRRGPTGPQGQRKLTGGAERDATTKQSGQKNADNDDFVRRIRERMKQGVSVPPPGPAPDGGGGGGSPPPDAPPPPFLYPHYSQLWAFENRPWYRTAA